MSRLVQFPSDAGDLFLQIPQAACRVLVSCSAVWFDFDRVASDLAEAVRPVDLAALGRRGDRCVKLVEGPHRRALSDQAIADLHDRPLKARLNAALQVRGGVPRGGK